LSKGKSKIEVVKIGRIDELFNHLFG